MFCPKCGSPINENSKFCGVCGTPIEKKVTPTSVIVEPKKKKKSILPLLLVIFLAVGGGVFAVSKMDLSQLNFMNKDNQDADVDSDANVQDDDTDENNNQQDVDDKVDDNQSNDDTQDDTTIVQDNGVTQLDENGFIINTVGFPNNCTIHEISLDQLDSICSDSIIEASWDGKFIKVTGEFWYQLHLETGTHSTYICDTINAIEFDSCGLITEQTLDNLDGFYIPIEIIGRIEKDNPITLQPYVIRLNDVEMSLVK